MLGKKKEEKAAEEKVETKAPVAATAKPAGKRELISAEPDKGKAMVSVGGVKLKVKCYYRREDKARMVGVAGKSVVLEDWLSGKADF
jgi:hypothetical protein